MQITILKLAQASSVNFAVCNFGKLLSDLSFVFSIEHVKIEFSQTKNIAYQYIALIEIKNFYYPIKE